MNTQTRIEIKPKNITPKGFLKFTLYLMIIIGFFSFLVGGFVLVLLGIWLLFIQPRNVKKNYPISYTLTEKEFTAYGVGGKIAWSIPWSDIQSLYIISQHWSMPKSLGIRLNNLSNFQTSLNQSKSDNFLQKFTKSTYNPVLMRLGRLVQKSDIVIHFMFIDRPAKEFAQLLYTYM